MAMTIRETAERALARLERQGFDDAQVTVNVTLRDELNFAHDEASLLRSTENHKLVLHGLLDARKVSTDLSDTSAEAIDAAAAALWDGVQSAPQDPANAVSAEQHAELVQGPQEGRLDLLAEKVRELLEFRAAHTPKMHLEEGHCAYVLGESQLLTSRGSDLAARIGSYEIVAMGTARDGTATSSFNYTGGDCHDPAQHHVADWFGIGDMLRDTEQQTRTQALDEGFTGDVVLAPNAVSDLLSWLLGQVGDAQLIANSSVYRRRVGDVIAAPQLSVRSRFDGPGVCGITADGFRAEPVTLIEQGRLCTLLPSLYGSRRTDLPHVPSLGAGWTIDAGDTAREDLVAAVPRGALVGRLSMGSPAANGDFSGVIKNSFLIRDGQRGPALSEVMITGNVAKMLQNIAGISRERIDSGGAALPWLRVTGLHFS